MEPQDNAKWLLFVRDQQVVSFKKGQIILFQGEKPWSAYVVKKGLVKAYNITGQGNEQLIRFYAPHETFPFTWIMEQSPVATYYYEALSDCQLYSVPRETYVNFIRGDTTTLFRELKRRANEEMISAMRLTALLQSKATDKLLGTLQCLIYSYGTASADKQTIEINMALTHQDLANFTGLARETVAIELNKLKRAGVIRYRARKYYSINMAKFAKILNERFITEAMGDKEVIGPAA